MKRGRRHSAFTLVELIMVIVIIGLLAAVVAPKFTDMRTQAQTAAEDGTISAIKSGINLSHMNDLTKGLDQYPAQLDSASNAVASATNLLFTDVIEGGVADANWEKLNGTTYRFNPTKNKYKYDKTTGAFTKQ